MKRIVVALLVSCAMPAAAATAPALPDVAYLQHVGAAVPANAVWRDESDRPVRLGDYLVHRPAVLALGYYGCSNLCSVVLQGVAHAVAESGLVAGRDVDVIAVSIDPLETPALARRRRAEVLRERPDVGWHFLTGDQSAIGALAHAVGFEYAQVDDPSAMRSYAHPAGLVLLTPAGRIARYWSGVAYPAATLRQAVEEARQERVATPAALQWMRCFHYDPQTGRYTPLAMGIVRVSGMVTLLGLAAWVGRMGVRRRGAHDPSRADRESS